MTAREINEERMLASTVAAMRRKLAKNRSKGGWLDDELHDLLARLREEVDELDAAIVEDANNGRSIIDEAADVANFAGMIIDVVHAAHGVPREEDVSEDERWARRVRLLERRLAFIEAAAKGEHDAMLRADPALGVPLPKSFPHGPRPTGRIR